jgi:hypothetical protein
LKALELVRARALQKLIEERISEEDITAATGSLVLDMKDELDNILTGNE